ncbi:MAG: outer membrane protein [Candidatus Krumholzibacteriia bacterium]
MSAALLAVSVLGCSSASVAAETPGRERTLLLMGLGAGALDLDIPHPERPGEDFGARFRLRFDLGYELRSWLEIGAELGIAMLGESDSLNALLRQRGSPGEASYTFVDVGVGVRARWLLGTGRWAPFVRGAVGAATLSLSAPDGLGSRQSDPTWSAGAGLEWTPYTPVVLRFEGRYMGQRSEDATRSHASAELVVLYALSTSRMDP